MVDRESSTSALWTGTHTDRIGGLSQTSSFGALSRCGHIQILGSGVCFGARP